MERGLAQAFVADALGLSIGYVSQVERNKRTVSLERLEAWEAVLSLNDTERTKLFQAAKMLPKKTTTQLLKVPEAWDLDFKKVADGNKRRH